MGFELRPLSHPAQSHSLYWLWYLKKLHKKCQHSEFHVETHPCKHKEINADSGNIKRKNVTEPNNECTQKRNHMKLLLGLTLSWKIPQDTVHISKNCQLKGKFIVFQEQHLGIISCSSCHHMHPLLVCWSNYKFACVRADLARVAQTARPEWPNDLEIWNNLTAYRL
jgi:hypothetical protein